MNKDLNALARACRRDGWLVVLTSGGHMRWTHPSGRSFISASTPSDHCAIRKIKVQIRRLCRGEEARR